MFESQQAEDPRAEKSDGLALQTLLLDPSPSLVQSKCAFEVPP